MPRPATSKFANDAIPFKSSRISHLFEALRVQKVKGGGGFGPFPDAVGVLGVISGELFEDEYELMPWDPVPLERIYKYGVSKPDLGVSIISLAHLN